MISIKRGSRCPVIDGTNISVYSIKLLLDNGGSVDDIVNRYRQRYPKLNARIVAMAYTFATQNQSYLSFG